jgi:hypothetical protein
MRSIFHGTRGVGNGAGPSYFSTFDSNEGRCPGRDLERILRGRSECPTVTSARRREGGGLTLDLNLLLLLEGGGGDAATNSFFFFFLELNFFFFEKLASLESLSLFSLLRI